MPFVERDAEGRIATIHREATGPAAEPCGFDDAEVQAFLNGVGSAEHAAKELKTLDRQMARIVEDLVDLLIEKNHIILTEFPPAVQEKLMQRKALRGRLNNLVGLVDDDVI